MFYSLQNYCKDKLKSRIFLGTYEEKRFISSVNDYRSVITLSPSETELSMDLQEIHRRFKKFYKDTPLWFSFSNTNQSGDNFVGTIFTDDLDDIPFGHFWFQIRTVKFKPGEVKIKVKTLRSVDEGDFNLSNRSSGRFSNASTSNSTASTNFDQSTKSNVTENLEWKDILTTWGESISENTKEFLYYKVNRENVKNIFNLLALITTGMAVGAFHFIIHVGNFSLRFMTEFSRLIHVCTPIFFGILDFFSKIIGGFFIFLTMLWKDSIGGGIKSTGPNKTQVVPYRPVYNRNDNWKQRNQRTAY